jgi:hypothetical protein
MKLLICAILLFSLLLEACSAQNDRRGLRFRSDGTFKVMFFTDLHFGWSDELDATTQRVMDSMLVSEEPDFVVLGGDTISNDAPGPNPKPPAWMAKYWARAVAALQKRGVPWSIVIGNHDLGTALSGSQVAALDASFNGSYTINSNDVSYYLSVLDASGSVPLTNLFFFNTHAYGCLNVASGSGCPTIENILWYANASLFLRQSQHGTPAGLAFMHIPPPEMMDVYNSGDWYGTYLDTDGVCCSAANTGLVANIMQQGNIQALTFGHDHGNDFFGAYTNDPDLTLAYGRKSGAGSYRVPGMLLGARTYLLQINNDNSPDYANVIYEGETTAGQDISISTWITLEDSRRLLQRQGTTLLRLATCCHW